MLKRIKGFIRKQIGTTEILQNQTYITRLLQTTSNKENEILKAAIFNNTIIDSEWLKYKSFSPGGWAVDYGFLYTLYRVLSQMHPISILEFGLGQSSKLIYQYADFYKDVTAVTCEHDPEWVKFFNKGINQKYNINIKQLELSEVLYKNEQTLSYKNINKEFNGMKYDLIVVDAPFGSERYSRSQILSLIENNLKETFCIIIDDYERPGEQETARELMNIFEETGTKYHTAIYAGNKQHILFCSENMKFLTSM